ncbi:hypothetical protein [Hymenobacter rubidus]|uniref:hypothetical protein n=1 Tax=Hymenobacter rubidus TaxID=1441626 RepID=UPI00191F9698|nr:hypothetical protein [Hymenobacter rubidus]
MRRSHTFYICLVVSLVLMAGTMRAARWNINQVFVSDMGGYYLYLPSAFLLNDLGNGQWGLAASRAHQPQTDQVTNMVTLPNGKVVYKYTMGMAVAYSPFFFLARGIYYAQGRRVTTGYEYGYQFAITWGCVAYVLLGLWVLGRELRRYFSDQAAALTVLIILLGTNLFTYTSNETIMSHGTLFLLAVLLLRYTRRWYEQNPSRWTDALWLGGVGGLLVLIRPSELMLLGVPVLWGLDSRTAVAGRLRFWRQRWGQALLIVGLVVLVAGQQLVFWRLVGGQWSVPFYKGEGFNFADPHIIDGVFSFRKGWLVYSPLMALSLVGIAWARRWAAPAWPVLLVLTPVYFYVTFCWWNWEYGGSYGGRALISLYPVLAFGMAAFWQRWLGPFRLAWFPPVLLLLLLSIIQNYQYLVMLLSCCDMSWEKYKDHFLVLSWPH